jgi:hypothetical protein
VEVIFESTITVQQVGPESNRLRKNAWIAPKTGGPDF